MLVGVPKELKTREYRVGLTPAGARTLVSAGHRVLIETGAGEGSHLPDEAYRRAGATVVPSAADAWAADMVVKVKEPLPSEYCYFRPDLLLYAYLHLAAEPQLTHELVRQRVTAVAYETIQLDDGSLPLLRPMSEVAGRMAVQVGATHLERERGGKGLLLGGVPGTRRGLVTILGGGVVGRSAATVAVGMGAKVTVLDIRTETLRNLGDLFGPAIETLYADPENIENSVRAADLLIGAVLVPGSRAPTLVSEALVAQMDPGSVIVDVAVDQGGCIATCRPTSHDRPTYELHGVVHYCVPNMPGAVAHTSTFALTNATCPYTLLLANRGLVAALADGPLLRGVNTYQGYVCYEPVAAAHGLPYLSPKTTLQGAGC